MRPRGREALIAAAAPAARWSEPVPDHSCRFSLAREPAVTLMFIDDSHSLHEGVANGGADEAESPLLQIPAHRIAVDARCGDAAEVQGPAAHHLAACEVPQILVEGLRFRPDLEVGLGVGDESVHLEPISDDAGILQQPPALGGAVARYFPGIETVEGFAVGLALAQDGKPAQAGLRALQAEHLEEPF